jgi:2-polyprenyl-6-methoxyphenol hydroxylase-like FAD-dependent oxidoreductase
VEFLDVDLCEVAARPDQEIRLFDTLIIGGGISGTLAATVLGRAGYSVCLIDRFEVYPRDFRVEHLDGAMIELLARLNLLDELTFSLFRGETVALARNGHVIGSTGSVNFGLRYETLVNRARATMPLGVHTETGRVTNIEASDLVQQAVLADGRTFRGRLIILATGQSVALCKQAGLKRRILREQHSLTFGFNIESTGPEPFAESFLVYQRENIQHRMDYCAAFTLGGRTRANLFTYRDYKEPWTKAFIADPDTGLRQVLPGLQAVLGPYRAVGPVEARPIDLYVSDNVNVNGVVVIGDAYQAACPATGMGMVRLLTDIEQLCRIHLPRWLETPGMGAEKIAAFYRDPVKQACDAKALHDSEYRRSVSTETSLRWYLHRSRVQLMERIRAWRNQLPTASHPRITEQETGPSLVAG